MILYFIVSHLYDSKRISDTPAVRLFLGFCEVWLGFWVAFSVVVASLFVYFMSRGVWGF